MSSEVVASSLNLDEQQPASSHTVQADRVQSAHAQKVNLLGMSRPQLEKFFEEMGEKKFRAGQVMKWIHQFFVTDFAEMTNISGKLREKLERICEIKAPEVVHRNYSKDGTRKWVFRVGDGAGSLVETVLIPAEDKTGSRKTLCKQGFQRDLLPDEIIGQLWMANYSYMEDVPVAERERSVTNVVMMGMGEPLLNYDAVLSSMNIMLDDFAYGMSKRRVTLSTSGVVPKIDQLAQDIDVALAISLHAPNDELRNELVPINKKYPLAQLIAACQRYIAKDGNESSRKHVTIEYVMLDGVNDQPEHAQQMIKLLKNLPSKINLIPFNPFPHAGSGRFKPKSYYSFQLNPLV
ncbi:hypothetical protein FQR65_LT20168 [Abscondita terminalis]|nr:hypothetical protein FQR65_LT20168 [Abscondita terminalis]